LYTGLLIADKDGGEVRTLLDCLTDPRYVAMSEDAENTTKELDLLTIPMDMLVLQEFEYGLRIRQSYCCQRIFLSV
jgi:hypothetical protein